MGYKREEKVIFPNGCPWNNEWVSNDDMTGVD